ncbi:MAG: hypothetical protein AAFY60_09600, partial [Myxococcota bacterium]
PAAPVVEAAEDVASAAPTRPAPAAAGAAEEVAEAAAPAAARPAADAVEEVAETAAPAAARPAADAAEEVAETAAPAAARPAAAADDIAEDAVAASARTEPPPLRATRDLPVGDTPPVGAASAPRNYGNVPIDDFADEFSRTIYEARRIAQVLDEVPPGTLDPLTELNHVAHARQSAVDALESAAQRGDDVAARELEALIERFDVTLRLRSHDIPAMVRELDELADFASNAPPTIRPRFLIGPRRPHPNADTAAMQRAVDVSEQLVRLTQARNGLNTVGAEGVAELDRALVRALTSLERQMDGLISASGQGHRYDLASVVRNLDELADLNRGQLSIEARGLANQVVASTDPGIRQLVRQASEAAQAAGRRLTRVNSTLDRAQTGRISSLRALEEVVDLMVDLNGSRWLIGQGFDQAGGYAAQRLVGGFFDGATFRRAFNFSRQLRATEDLLAPSIRRLDQQRFMDLVHVMRTNPRYGRGLRDAVNRRLAQMRADEPIARAFARNPDDLAPVPAAINPSITTGRVADIAGGIGVGTGLVFSTDLSLWVWSNPFGDGGYHRFLGERIDSVIHPLPFGELLEESEGHFGFAETVMSGLFGWASDSVMGAVDGTLRQFGSRVN